MSSTQGIRAGVAGALSSLQSVTGHGGLRGFQVVEYQVSAPLPPTIQFYPEKVEYDQAGSRGLDVWTWVVQAFVAVNFDRAAQEVLDALLAPSGR